MMKDIARPILIEVLQTDREVQDIIRGIVLSDTALQEALAEKTKEAKLPLEELAAVDIIAPYQQSLEELQESVAKLAKENEALRGAHRQVGEALKPQIEALQKQIEEVMARLAQWQG